MCHLYPNLTQFMRCESSKSHNPQRGGIDHTGYHRDGSVHLQPWSTTSTHQKFYTAKFHNCSHHITNNHSTTPHKIFTRLWHAVWRWNTRFLMHKWSIWWTKKGLKPAASIHSSRRFSLGETCVKQHMILTSDALNDFTKSIYKFRCLSRTQISSCRITTSDNISTRDFGIPRTPPHRSKQQTPQRVQNEGC